MYEMDKKKYTLDGEPISARSLLDAAAAVCERFDKDWFKTTSAAAIILRENGQEVGVAEGYQ